MATASWNGEVIAASDDIVHVEGNAYFPRAALKDEFFEESQHHTECAWKGTASYLDVVVDGKRNENAAWYYPDPSSAARKIEGRVAFWNGVRVDESVMA
ncbi:MAG: DUF427 domain-containing protein [Actinomycetota bacterium]